MKLCLHVLVLNYTFAEQDHKRDVCMCQVYEVVPCLSDCGQYVWVAEPWSVWKVSNVDLKHNCGEGVQTRKVR